MLRKLLKLFINTGFVYFSIVACCYALNTERLADAIQKAENSYRHPYGILKPYCKPGDPDGKCRLGCIQTIEKWRKKLSYTTDRDFIEQFSKIY